MVAVKGGRLLGSGRGHGIRPLLELFDRLGGELLGASVADRVIGRAAAFILMEAQVAAVYGETMSDEARRLLNAADIVTAFGHSVPFILKPDRTERCLMEQQVLGVNDPAEAVSRLRRFVQRA